MALTGALALAGCGRPAGAIFDPAEAVAVWPPPPDEPRVRYLGQLRADRDLKPARSFVQGVGATLLGQEDTQTMLSPIAVCTDGGDRVFVVDSNAQVVHVFDLSTRRYRAWKPPEKVAAFAQPVGAAWDPAGRLLVSDSVAGVIFVFGSGGDYEGTLGHKILWRPCGLAVADGRIYVADAAAHQIVVLSADGAEVARLGSRGAEPGQFNFPTNVALDDLGRLYVSDSLNFRVQVFDPDLLPLRQFGRKGDMPGYFAQPKGIAVGPDGFLYVVDAHFEAVQVFDTEGTLLMTFGREGHGAGEFWLPNGVHADPQGRLWIADSYNRRVQVFEPIGDGEVP